MFVPLNSHCGSGPWWDRDYPCGWSLPTVGRRLQYTFVFVFLPAFLEFRCDLHALDFGTLTHRLGDLNLNSFKCRYSFSPPCSLL